MSTTKRLLLILTILFSCVGCDQATKSVAKAYLSETHTVVLLGDTVRLQLAKNYGAFLSLGSSVGEAGCRKRRRRLARSARPPNGSRRERRRPESSSAMAWTWRP